MRNDSENWERESSDLEKRASVIDTAPNLENKGYNLSKRAKGFLDKMEISLMIYNGYHDERIRCAVELTGYERMAKEIYQERWLEHAQRFVNDDLEKIFSYTVEKDKNNLTTMIELATEAFGLATECHFLDRESGIEPGDHYAKEVVAMLKNVPRRLAGLKDEKERDEYMNILRSFIIPEGQILGKYPLRKSFESIHQATGEPGLNKPSEVNRYIISLLDKR